MEKQQRRMIEEAFALAGPQGMRDFLEDLFSMDETLQQRFVTRFVPMDAAVGKKMLLKELNEVADRCSDRSGFISWRGALDFESRYIDAIESHMDALASRGDAEGIFSSLEAVLKNFHGLTFDDSYGLSTSVMDSCSKYWSLAFDALETHRVADRFRRLRDFAQSFGKNELKTDNDWIIKDAVEGFLVDRFAEDRDHAYLVRAIAEDELAASASAFATSKFLRERHEQRWTLILLRTMRAQGCSAAEIKSVVDQHLCTTETIFFLVDALLGEGEATRAMLLLEQHCAAADDNSLLSRSKLENRLLHLYLKAGCSGKVKDLIESQLFTDKICSRSVEDLLHVYRGLFEEGEWPEVREGLLDKVASPRKKCDVLMAEGLHDRLALALAEEHMDLYPYEKYLIDTGHGDVVARSLCEHGKFELENAYDRYGYSRGAKTLARAASLTDDGEPACTVAAELRARFPRKTALHDELKKLGL